MSKLDKSFLVDAIIIFFMILIFLTVIIIFYTEIIKNNKISNANNNFFIIKEELLLEINKCKDKSQKWFIDIPCNKKPSAELVSNYFNNSKRLINPYDGKEGVRNSPGSVLIQILDNAIVLSVDNDANGGIDIEQKINLN